MRTPCTVLLMGLLFGAHVHANCAGNGFRTHGHGKSSRHKGASDEVSPQASQYLRVRSSAGSTTGSCSWTTTVGCVCTVHFHAWYLVHLRYAALIGCVSFVLTQMLLLLCVFAGLLLL
jgi:hypothetical protein